MDSGQHANEQRPGIIRRFLSFVICIAVVLVAAWGLRTYVVEPFEVPSASMETTIMTGDRIFAEKVTYNFESPRAGDIVLFNDPETPARVLVKRVVAVGGQTVDLQDGYVVVDGVKLAESYTRGSSYPLASSSITYPYTVPQGEVWVMGDNRENSQDSRYFGSVDVDTVFGKAMITYWPFEDFGFLK